MSTCVPTYNIEDAVNLLVHLGHKIGLLGRHSNNESQSTSVQKSFLWFTC